MCSSSEKEKMGILNMKYTLTLLIILLLAPAGFNAQIKRANTYELTKEKIAAKKISSETQWKINLRNDSQLREKVSYKEYDRRGLLVKSIQYGAADSVMSESILAYDDKGRLLSSRTRRAGKDGTLNNVYTYDSVDKLSKIETYDETNNLMVAMNHTYDAPGSKLSKLETIASGNRVHLIVTYTYDSNANLTEVITNDIRNNIRSRGVFGYDENNNLVSQLIYDNNERLIQSTEKKYDSQKNLISEVAKNANAAVISEEKYVVDASGNFVEKEVINPAANISKRVTYKYDENNIMAEQTLYNKLDEPVSKIIYEYGHYEE